MLNPWIRGYGIIGMCITDWLRCIFHDLFGHPAVLNHGELCQGCRGRRRAFCSGCWHHYTVSY